MHYTNVLTCFAHFRSTGGQNLTLRLLARGIHRTRSRGDDPQGPSYLARTFVLRQVMGLFVVISGRPVTGKRTRWRLVGVLSANAGHGRRLAQAVCKVQGAGAYERPH